MSVTPLRKWDVTGIEIALDLEAQRLLAPSRFAFSGAAEPRVCLVVGFALSSQLKRIVAAVDRVVPTRLPSGIRATPSMARSATAPAGATISIQPMFALMRLQLRLIRAIEPGLAHDMASHGARHRMEETAARFVGEFISRRTLPTLDSMAGWQTTTQPT